MQPDLRVESSDGTVVGYSESGAPAGPPILYLHGSPSSRLEAGLPGMREVAEDLGLRVITPDRPGIGLAAFRQGGRGPAHDLTLEARPWGVPFQRIEVPIDIWHGEGDRLVSAEQARILARALPLVTEHYVPGEGHLSLFSRHAGEILRSVLPS